MIRICLLILFTAFLGTRGFMQEESLSGRRNLFISNWLFHPADLENGSSTSLNDAAWRILNLPHDWSIEGSFSESNPATPGGGALPGGIGWYRKHFRLPEEMKGKNIFIDFDGVYRCSEVWINGNYLGKRPNGYISFQYEITPYINTGNKENIIAVRVDNSQQPNSRWYSGSGIYRNVWLTVTSSVAIDHWGVFVTTQEVSKVSARVSISLRVRNNSINTENIRCRTEIVNAQGTPVGMQVTPELLLKQGTEDQQLSLLITSPHLWSTEDPYLYKLITTILKDGKIVDKEVTSFGIRSFSFDEKNGFFLNNKSLKIKGVCNHHDLGCLGAAIHPRALERQLLLLKAMGCNGIRTSHNPPAPELLDLCDQLGFIVMDEAFDMWKIKKTEFDYSIFWDEWHEKDLEDMVLRDRNHPSIFMWSIGNEILEQWDSTGTAMAMELRHIVRAIDTTRPVTSACNEPTPWNYLIKSGALDLIGYNYHEKTFADFPATFPGQKFIGSETTSALASRGIYDFPADSVRRWPIRWDIPFREGKADHTCSSFDNCSAPWGSTHEETWKLIKAYDFLSGMFIWTGFDYLGEPTPYSWPSRSSYFGILDLCGFPKDAYYMYQSEWTSSPMLHLFPHWNWTKGRLIDVWAYSNAQEVELFLNGKSLGLGSKKDSTFHYSWLVPFEPGRLEASARTNGIEVAHDVVFTAGIPAAVHLKAERTTFEGATDLVFVEARIVDNQNRLVPGADNLVKFSVEGDAEIVGVDNGCQSCHESFKSDQHKAFSGKCLCILKSGKRKGTVKLTASSEGLADSSINLVIQ